MGSLCYLFAYQYTSSSRLSTHSKMVNTRSKIQKIKNTVKLCSLEPEAAMADSNQQATQSGTLIGSNDDLLIEILSRMPATSVLRFKSVSKHWRWLLSQRRFTLLYKNASTTPGFFVCSLYIPFDVENRSTPPFRKLDFSHDLSGIRILQSCNGLLLCCSYRGRESDRKYYVFNPTTKQFALIPSVPGGMDARKTIRFMCLAFHQTDCVHYKVVCIRCAKPDEGLNQIQIYSSDTRKWKILNELFFAPYYPPFYRTVYLNQTIYWAPSCDNPLYFKLDTEEIKSLPLPMPVASSGGYRDGAIPLYFGESRGHLHLVETADPHVSYLHLNVYEMLNDHSGWFVKYQVELDELANAYPEMIDSYLDPSSPHYYEFECFDVVRGEEEDETFILIKIPGKIIRYNVVDKSFKEIFDISKIFFWRIGYSEVHRYIESLISF